MTLETIQHDLNIVLQERDRAYPIRTDDNSQQMTILIQQFIDTLSNIEISDWQPDPARLAITDGIEDKPIFICGAKKSGSTMLVELLDNHPNLVVFPGDTHLMSHFSDNTLLYTDPKITSDLWIKRFVNPRGQTPFWILGDNPTSYVEFTQYCDYYFNQASKTKQDYFKVIVQAYVATNQKFSSDVRYWVTKTPGNEHEIDRILSHFPKARFLHIVREPGDNVISLQKLTKHRALNARIHHNAQYVAKSLQAGLDNQTRLGKERYHIVRYEDIIDDPTTQMQGIASFIGIPFDKTLLTPTVNGMLSRSNSQYQEQIVTGEILRRPHGKWRKVIGDNAYQIEAILYPLAQKFGYNWQTISTAKLFALRLRYGMFRLSNVPGVIRKKLI